MIIIDKINYKLINFALILIIFFFIILTKSFWINILLVVKKILTPIVLSFTTAYFFNAVVNLLNVKSKKYNLIKIIVLFLFLFVFSILFYFAFPILIKEILNILSSILKFSDMVFNNNIDEINFIKPIITDLIARIINGFSNNGFTYFFKSIDIISNFIIILILSVYFLFKIEDIKKYVKAYLKKYNRLYLVIKNIDVSLNNYLKSLFIIVIIEMVEYTFIYFLIGHENFLLIGLLAGLTTIIPYFGALFTNIIALITASNNLTLFILSSLVILICPIFDSYIIDPKIYHKNINITPIATIISIIVCSNLFGFIGVVIAIPFYIITREIFKVYLKK